MTTKRHKMTNKPVNSNIRPWKNRIFEYTVIVSPVISNIQIYSILAVTSSQKYIIFMENGQNVITKLNYQFMDRTNKRLFFIYIQIGCAVLIIITIIENYMFNSHKNNINLNYHTDCVFAVRILSFIHHPQWQLEYTHQHVRLLLVWHHQNAKCSCFCWVRWLSCILASFYCLS